MSSIKSLSIIFLTTVLALGLWAGFHHRIEMVDGSQALFHLMNNNTYQNYINHRSLGSVLHYSAYFNAILIKLGVSFKTIYLLHNIAIALNPFLISLISIVFLFKHQKSHLIPFYIIAFLTSVLSTYSFHVSLVPESILFGWLAFFCWQNSNSKWSYVLGIPSCILMNLGYESSCGFSLFIILGTIYLAYQKKLFSENSRSSNLKILMSFLSLFTIIYRVLRFQNFGVYAESAHQSINANYPELYYIIISIILLFLIHHKKVNSLIIYSTLLLLNTYILLFLPTNEMKLFSGYNLRTIVFIPSMLCLLLMIINESKKHISARKLIPFCYISLLIFAINDVQLTALWQTYREKRFSNLSEYSQGCYRLDHGNWEVPYFSINYQQTFKPTFFVIDNKDDTRCQIVDSEFKRVPKMYEYDRVRNYDFSLFFAK